jgi:hypothetical protein
MAKGSIEWTKISPRMKVVSVRSHYEAAGKLVTWGSRDAVQAQRYLMTRVRSDAQRFGRK